MRWISRVPILVLLAWGVTSPPAAAQSTDTIADLLSLLLTNRSVETGDFQRDEAAVAATRDAIARSLQIQLATLPISSSSGGFTYRFNPALGTTERTSDSFGPFFVERALTSGRGRASFGVSFRYARFDSLDGNDLRDGSFVTTANQFTDESSPFDFESLTLRLSTSTVTGFANVGVTDRLDLGVAVPIVSLRLDGTRYNTYRGLETLQASASGSVVGLADMALRAKFNFAGAGGSGLAAAGEVRLPTGNEEDLLGAGKASVRMMLIGSHEAAAVGVHGNVSYTAGGIADVLDYSAALTGAVTPTFTLTGEVVGRSVQDLGRLQPLTLPHPTILGVSTTRLVPDTTTAHTAFVVGGFKWNLGSTWLLTGNVAIPVNDRGLHAAVTPSIAFDYAFGQ